MTNNASASGLGERAPVAALDIGGTKIADAVVEADGSLLHPVRRAIPRLGTAEEVMAVVTQVLGDPARHPRWSEVRMAGIGSAGPVDRARGTVSPVNIPAWRDFPLADRVRQTTGLPVALAGDGVALGLPGTPYLRPGDTVRLEIDGLGTQTQIFAQA